MSTKSFSILNLFFYYFLNHFGNFGTVFFFKYEIGCLFCLKFLNFKFRRLSVRLHFTGLKHIYDKIWSNYKISKTFEHKFMNMS